MKTVTRLTVLGTGLLLVAVGCPDLDLSAVAINICNLARHDVTHHPTGDAGVSGRSG